MKAYIRSLITALLVALVVLTFSAEVVAPYLPPVVGSPTVQEVRRFAQSNVDLVRLENVDGPIWVWAHRGGEVEVSAAIRVYGHTASGRALAEEYADSLVSHGIHDGVLDVVSEPGERPDDVDVVVNYRVLVPTGTSVQVRNVNGNVWISEGCGDVTVHGRNTDIKIVRPEGEVLAESVNGRVQVLDAVRGTDVKTVNGNVYAHMQGGALRAETTNGATVAHVLRPEVTACMLRAQNGGITLVLSEGCSAKVDARTALGLIKTDLSMEGLEGRKRKRRLCGIIGEGKTDVTMDTLKGNIWITGTAS